MRLYKNTMTLKCRQGWSRRETIAYFLKGVARELKIAPVFFEDYYNGVISRFNKNVYRQKRIQAFKKKWLVSDGVNAWFDFGICKLPDISSFGKHLHILVDIFEDVFLFPCFLNDQYDKFIVEYLDCYMGEGPYGYTDGKFDVTVKKGDVIIDAGAWIGDFSAYAASKGAIVYAFEPTKETFDWLQKTKTLNCMNGEGQIYPVQKGLGVEQSKMNIFISETNSGSNSLVFKGEKVEKIAITTLDKFVKENQLERVDFIKADIEGAERDMLKGAANVLKMFAPKLAICTYHLPDDPEVLEKIIKEANPDYTVVHLRHKLFATVIK
jgi:FkbM family methyltransferase